MRSRLFFLLILLLLPLSIRAETTWTVQDDGTMQSIRGITGSGDVLVAVGNTGNRMRSTDAGATWTLLSSSGSVWWHDVDVAANGDFLAVGESGAYAYSEDDGATWASASLGVSNTFYDIDRAASSTGYVVGASGTVVYYANGNWFSGTPNVTETLYAVQDNADGTAWVVGGAGRFLKASNNGITWTNFGRIGSDTLLGVYFESASTGWIVGENGTFKKTTDGGVSWLTVSVSGLSTQHLSDIQAVGDRMVVAGDKIVLLSEDGGDTWTSESFVDENITFYTSYVRDESHVWVAGTDYDVYSSVYHYEVVEDVVEEEPATEESVDPGFSLGEPAEAEPSNLIKLTCEEGADVNDPCRAVYYYATDGKRHAFPNEKVYFTWFDNFDDVIEVSADFMSDLTLGSNVTYHPGTRMVKFQSVPTVYAVARYGELRAIASEDIASDLYGSDWNQQIDDISDAFFSNYSFGETINSVQDYNKDEAQASVNSLDDNF
ncbi:hypothetical protein EPN81_04280 [Patescibacteria group bacterium]|nr:MAG: hypothetical protein EPN81_04280 [Patescibacteria group bacterium]